MRRKNYMFTNKKHPQRGIISAIFGVLNLSAAGLTIFTSFQIRGAANARLGAEMLLVLLVSIAGLVFGILSRMEKDKFYIFPVTGIILNTVSFLTVVLILFAGALGL